MEQKPRKKTILTCLIVTVLGIAAVIVLFGTFYACLCTCGSCAGFNGCMPVCGKFEWLPDHSDAWLETAAPTAAPTAVVATPEPTAPESVSPLDQELPLAATPIPADLSDWVREKQVKLRHDGTDTATVLVLMNGSDLESDYQEATADLSEMVRADKSERVNILIETVGTRSWDRRYGISSRRSERYRVTDSGLTLVDGTLGQLDTTVPSTLSDFIRWGAENYPADRYILVLWDHGGGPVYGFGYDEFQPYTASLTIDEIQTALRDGGVYFDLIGMDCCLMASVEVVTALYDYCDYTLLSEDFEPGSGWEHSGWLSALAHDPALPTPRLAKIAIDDSVRVCERHISTDGGTVLALIDESYARLLFRAWLAFAYENEDALLAENYSQLREATGRAHPRLSRAVGTWSLGDDAVLSDYCITDLLSLADNIPSERSESLRAALGTALVYCNATSDETTLSGLSVTLPYGDREFYYELRRVFKKAGFEDTYLQWLERFTEVDTGSEFFDFGGWSVSDVWDFSGDWYDVLDWLIGN